MERAIRFTIPFVAFAPRAASTQECDPRPVSFHRPLALLRDIFDARRPQGPVEVVRSGVPGVRRPA
jgi:hypothetical protein